LTEINDAAPPCRYTFALISAGVTANEEKGRLMKPTDAPRDEHAVNYEQFDYVH
jgi:hypothetical protein